jgi:hypothetical protein
VLYCCSLDSRIASLLFPCCIERFDDFLSIVYRYVTQHCPKKYSKLMRQCIFFFRSEAATTWDPEIDAVNYFHVTLRCLERGILALFEIHVSKLCPVLFLF